MPRNQPHRSRTGREAAQDFAYDQARRFGRAMGARGAHRTIENARGAAQYLIAGLAAGGGGGANLGTEFGLEPGSDMPDGDTDIPDVSVNAGGQPRNTTILANTYGGMMATKRSKQKTIKMTNATRPPDVYGDWMKSILRNSKFAVQFACDWKAAQKERKITWHVFRHNMSTLGSGYQQVQTALGPPIQTDGLKGLWTNDRFPLWMDPPDGNAPTLTGLFLEDGVLTKNNVLFNSMLKPCNMSDTKLNTLDALGNPLVSTVTTPFIEQKQNMVYYAPMNLADFEDVCFYNNKIPQFGNSAPPYSPANTIDNTQSMMLDAHRANGLISSQNSSANATAVGPTPEIFKYIEELMPATATQDARPPTSTFNQFKVNMLGGNVNYNFINKSPGPNQITVKVFKWKTTHVSPKPFTFSSFPADRVANRFYIQLAEAGANSSQSQKMANYGPAGEPVNCLMIQKLLNQYGQAYLKQAQANVSLDSMGGKQPSQTDVWLDPKYPLLKKYKKYFAENLCDFSEHSTCSYVLPAGGRKTVNIALPSDHFNPALDAVTASANASPAITHGADWIGSLDYGLDKSEGAPDAMADGAFTANPGSHVGNVVPTPYLTPINPFSHHTYMVMIAVNGVPMTAKFSKTPPKSAPPTGLNPISPQDVHVGNEHSAAHVQCYANYSEKLGPMSYKPSTQSLYNHGRLCDSTVTDAGPESAVQLDIGIALGIDRSVRVPGAVHVHPIQGTFTTPGPSNFASAGGGEL